MFTSDVTKRPTISVLDTSRIFCDFLEGPTNLLRFLGASDESSSISWKGRRIFGDFLDRPINLLRFLGRSRQICCDCVDVVADAPVETGSRPLNFFEIREFPRVWTAQIFLEEPPQTSARPPAVLLSLVPVARRRTIFFRPMPTCKREHRPILDTRKYF